ncbi:MAG: hypothetical protein E6Q97_08530 [Desulfurellales bacterium]|nr:MAG: hypothetical protein E6Q97_08530 [Desulfurellales bacterium]
MNELAIGTYMHGTPVAREVSITPEDWRRHAYVVGATGVGKSTLFKKLMLQRPAFCLIDKEGDLAREVADAMPCIYLQASRTDFRFALNVFQDVPPDRRSELAAGIHAMCSDIWDLGEHTPQLNDTLYFTIRLAIDTAGATLVDLPRLLTDDLCRARFLKKCRDRDTREFWEDFATLDRKAQREAIRSTLNKVRAFTRSDALRFTLGQSTSTINIRDIIDSGKTVVVDLSGIGAEPARLLGAVIVFQFYLAAQNRNDSHRPDYTLFIDEFEDFASRTMPDILSKVRKRHLSLCIAHQYVSQLPDHIRDAIFANCGTYVCFSIGPLDAPLLSKVLDRPETDLTAQRTGHAWVAIMHKGRRLRSIPIMMSMPVMDSGYIAGNIEMTRKRYARTREDAQYQLDWYERVKWAREQYAKKAEAEKAIDAHREEAEWGD